MPTTLIAGCGDVGTALGLLLAARGHQVWGLRRHPDGLPAPIRPLAADLTDPASLSALPGDLHYVVYAAAAPAYEEAAYRRVYVHGVRNLLQAVEHGALRRVLFVSSTALYAQSDGSWVDEDSPTEPQHFSGRCMLEGEAQAAAAGCPAVAVRFGGIYGPGRGRLLEAVRQGRPCVQDPPLYTNRIHRDDCAAVLAHLLELPQVAPVYVGVDREPAPQCQVMDWLAARLGVACPPRTGGAGPGAGQRSSKRCSSARLVASGYRFAYPSYREGYAAVLKQAPG